MPKSPVARLWIIGCLAVGVLVAFIGYTTFISPQNSDTSAAQGQTSVERGINASLQARINELQAQSKNLSQYQSELQLEQLALPSSSGLPDFLRTLQAIGNATHTNVSALTVGAPTDVTGVAASAPTPATSSSAAGSVTPTVNGVRVYSLPISATVAGSTGALDQFLVQLQSVQPRAVLISQLTESAATGTNRAQTTLQLTMNAFVAPSSAAQTSQLSAAAAHK